MTGLRALAFTCLVALRAWPDSCAPVQHDQIAAADVATVLPEFGKLSPDIPVAPAPIPGARRVIRSSELLSIARKYGLELGSAADTCFAWPMQSLDRDRVRAAMEAALPFPGSQIELLEMSAYAVPSGKLEFRREAIGSVGGPASRTPVTWPGNVIYGNNRRFSVWARVIVSAKVPRLVAVETIRRGQPIQAGQFRLETVDAFPGSTDAAQTADQVIGRVAVRAIEAGAEIRLSQVALPQDVHRGDSVDVEVRSGATHLSFTGKSESDGRTGDLIRIRNLRSNKIFQARVGGKDKAFVDTGAVREN